MITDQKMFPIYTEVSKEAITFCKLIDPKTFNFPFFNDEVKELKNLELPQLKFNLKDLAAVNDVNLLEVKGFIFHTSHCGST